MNQPILEDLQALSQQFQSFIKRLEIAWEESHEAIARIDRRGCLQWCNRQFSQRLNRSPATLKGIDLATVLNLEQGGKPVPLKRHPVRLALTSELSTGETYRWISSHQSHLVEIISMRLPSPLSSAILIIRLRSSQQTTQSRSNLYQFIAEHASDWISRQTTDGMVLYASPACQRLLDYAPETLIGRSAFELYHEDDRDRVQKTYQQLLHHPQQPVTLTCRLRHENLYYLWFEITLNAVRNQSNGNVCEIVAVARDITDRLSYQTTLQRNEKRFRALIENITDTITILDRQGNLRYASPSIEKLLGYPVEARLGQPTLPLVCEDNAPQVRRAFWRLLRRPDSYQYLSDFQVYHADGNLVAIEATMTNMLHDPAVEGIVINCHNITERKQVENQLRHDALHDALTGLPNRTLFMERLFQAIAQRKRHPDCGFAVLYLDLDRFKAINDSLGHLAGDRLLVEVARRLERQVRGDDTVARLSGDEFAILLPDITTDLEAHKLAARLQQCLQKPLQLDYQEVTVTASIGIVIASDRDLTPSDLLRDADSAMYRAKQLGKARQELFDSTMSQNALQLLKLSVDLRHALSQNALELYYQPIVTLQTGQIHGVEALLRWNHPELGFVSPSEFIPIAEDTGAIVPLGWWTLQQACQQLSQWHRQFPDFALTASVNLSGRQFSQPALVEQVWQILQATGLEARSLKLEITETTICENADTVVNMLERLKAMNVQLSIDDFGTGYSSLSRLRSFPLDTLKIDRSFVSTIDSDSGNFAITKSIVMLAEALNITTIAEGVETTSHLAKLRELGCQYAQGYLFAHPLPADEMTELLAQNPCW